MSPILHRFKPKNTTEKLIFREIYSIITNSQNIRRVGETSRVGENLGGWDFLVPVRGLILTGGWDFSRERVRSRAVKPAPSSIPAFVPVLGRPSPETPQCDFLHSIKIPYTGTEGRYTNFGCIPTLRPSIWNLALSLHNGEGYDSRNLYPYPPSQYMEIWTFAT